MTTRMADQVWGKRAAVLVAMMRLALLGREKVSHASVSMGFTSTRL